MHYAVCVLLLSGPSILWWLRRQTVQHNRGSKKWFAGVLVAEENDACFVTVDSATLFIYCVYLHAKWLQFNHCWAWTQCSYLFLQRKLISDLVTHMERLNSSFKLLFYWRGAGENAAVIWTKMEIWFLRTSWCLRHQRTIRSFTFLPVMSNDLHINVHGDVGIEKVGNKGGI